MLGPGRLPPGDQVDRHCQQRQRIEALAQAVLDSRAMFPQASLADLYDREVNAS